MSGPGRRALVSDTAVRWRAVLGFVAVAVAFFFPPFGVAMAVGILLEVLFEVRDIARRLEAVEETVTPPQGGPPLDAG